MEERPAEATGPTFTFINVGGRTCPTGTSAPWSAKDNRCHSFQTVDHSAECRTLPTACLKLDTHIDALLARHLDGTIIIFGDHCDRWGEHGPCEQGILRETTTTLPLLIRYRGQPLHELPASAAGRMSARIARRLPQRVYGFSPKG